MHKTKLLMKGSITPEAVQFWKKHLEELSQKIGHVELGGANVNGGTGWVGAGIRWGTQQCGREVPLM